MLNVTAAESLGRSSAHYNFLALVFGVLLILVIILGNILVCLSVLTERSLKTATNYFIVSLAIADLLLAVLVLPLYVYSEFLGGVWTLSTSICDALMTMDVMLCTASILNLCAISVDRYIAVVVPLKYNRNQFSVRQLVLIAATWVLSFGVASPVIFGLNQVPGRNASVCRLEDDSFVVYSSVCSFFVPCPIMLLLYYWMFRGLHRWSAGRRSKLQRGERRFSLSLHGLRHHPGRSKVKYLMPSLSPALSPSSAETPGPVPGLTVPDNVLDADLATTQLDSASDMEGPERARQGGPRENGTRGPKIRRRKSGRVSGRERKAMKVLPIVVGVFLACWSPFFVVHVTKLHAGDLQRRDGHPWGDREDGGETELRASADLGCRLGRRARDCGEDWQWEVYSWIMLKGCWIPGIIWHSLCQINMLNVWRILICSQMAINITCTVIKANACLGGQDIFATMPENSPPGKFVANISIAKAPEANSIRLCLTGENADWFYLEGKSIRLNSSSTRVLDREVQGSVLIAALACHEDDVVQREYGITVEILNENDNVPAFLERSVQPFDVSELTAVNAVIFTVQAQDADNDTIVYAIDTSSTDAAFFRIEQPESGMVMLAKPLDYETKTKMQFVIYAAEISTEEKHSTAVSVTVNVVDEDDQYPQFQPCVLLSQSGAPPICTSPIYTANITVEEQGTILYFSPGPIHAEDGDKGLMTPLIYTILSGGDDGRFRINNDTGEVSLTRRIEKRLPTPILNLKVMASQRDDPKKFAVATAMVHVLAKNRFPPEFTRKTYEGFITKTNNPAALVNTYGNVALVIEAVDRDFEDGINPQLRYSLRPESDATGIYHITQEGHVIARANQLRASNKHYLEVIATDQESGDVANASLHIEVLQTAQSAPRSPFGEGRLFGAVDASAMLGLVGVITFLVAAAISLLLLLLGTRKRRQRDPAEPAGPAPGELPNTVNQSGAAPLMEKLSYHNQAFSERDASSPILQGKHGVYTRKGSMVPTPVTDKDYIPHDAPVNLTVPESPTRSVSTLTMTNRRASDKPVHKSVSFQDEVAEEEEGFTSEHSSSYRQFRRDEKQENVQGAGVAQSPRELTIQSNQKRWRKAAGEESRKDESQAAKGAQADTPPLRLKGQEGNGDNEDIEVPENPYKL
ncbi:hypothetical protein GJAV_G00268910 [Gymnothorax javanicus]|nr:hypothetical protein GJAV_G00268910 [Gymnothorax javanicus]